MRSNLIHLTFVVLMTLFGLNVAANETTEVIKNICTLSKAPNLNTPLSKVLNEVQDKYKDQADRVNNPIQFVNDLDRIIKMTEFSPILKCREDLSKINYTYLLKFQNPSHGDDSMNVAHDDENKTVTLNFNLTKSVQRVLFVYLHELTHVCQKAEKVGVANLGEFVRLSLYGEIEAFYKMQLAYRSFLPHSARLCKAEGVSSDSPQFPLYEAYLDLGKALDQGSFAQSITYGYTQNNWYSTYKSELLYLNSPLHSYKNGKEIYQLNSLHPAFKKLIEERLEIKVIEP